MQSVLEPSSGLVTESANEDRYDGHVYEPEEVTGVVCGMIPEGSRVLDVGCGSGSVSLIVRDKTHSTLVGVEPSATRAKLARERGLEVIEAVLSDELIGRLGRFDVVLFADVIEHLSDPESAIAAVRGCLTPEGVLIVSVPNVAHWSVRWNLLMGRFDYEPCGIMDATHLRWFTRRSLHRVLASAGFTINRTEYTVGFGLPVYLRTWPWRILSKRIRNAIIRRGRRYFPNLFGCQIVVQAQLTT